MTTRPGVASFDNELPTANWGDIWLSLIALGIVSAVFGFIAVQIYGAALNPLMNPSLKNLSPASRDIFQQAMGRSTGSAWASIVTVPIGFFIGMALLFVCAKIVGGTGSFLSQSYAAALYYVPIYGLAAVVQVVPVLGQIASALLGIYGLILGVMALAASQRLTIGRAIGAFAILIGAAVVLACALIIVIALIFAAVFRQTTP